MKEDEFHSEFGYLIQKISLVLRRETDRILRKNHGVSRTQFLLLSSLHKNKDAYDAQKQLAAHLGVTKGAVSRQLFIARQRGWVLQSQLDKDNRQKSVELTAKGFEILMMCRTTIDRAENGIFAGVPQLNKKRLIKDLALINGKVSTDSNQL